MSSIETTEEASAEGGNTVKDESNTQNDTLDNNKHDNNSNNCKEDYDEHHKKRKLSVTNTETKTEPESVSSTSPSEESKVASVAQGKQGVYKKAKAL